MNITTPGRVTDRILLLGRYESCLYLLDGGSESWIVGGAMAYVAPDIVDQLAALGVDEQRIGRIVILHAHFDHCGAVPYLKRRWPGAVVTASARAKELLSKPQIVSDIGQMNNAAISQLGLDRKARELGVAFDGLTVEETLSDGDRLSCGTIDIEVLGVPGHSSCSIALYLPAEKALFASDAVGLKLNGVFQPTPNSNYDLYQKSLERMARYDVKTLLLEHFGAFLGDEAEQFIPGAIAAADETRRLLEETYRRTRDVKQCTEEITAHFLSRSADSFLPDEVRATVAGQMVRFIAKTMDKEAT